MIVVDFSVSSLSQFVSFKDKIGIVRPQECSTCKSKDSFWKHGQYLRGVCEQGVVKSIAVQRLICRQCRLTVSIQFAFLVPYRQFTLHVIAYAITDYLEKKNKTYRSIASELSGDGGGDEHRPNFSQLWRWVNRFARMSKQQLAMRLQREAIEQGKEAGVEQVWESVQVEPKKAHTREKLAALGAAARVMALARLLLQVDESALIKLQTYLASKVNGLCSIFAGHAVRLSATRNLQQMLF